MRVADHPLRELRKQGEWRELEDEVDGGHSNDSQFVICSEASATHTGSV